MSRSLRPYFLALALLLVSLLKFGVTRYPSLTSMADIAATWRDLLTGHEAPLHTFHLASAWLPIAAGVVGASTLTTYTVFSLIAALVAMALPFVMTSIRTEPGRAEWLFLLLAASALPAVLLGWVGSYDPLTVAAITIAVLARNRWVVWAGWFVLGLNHVSLAVVCLAVWLVAVGFHTGRGRDLWRDAGSAAGALGLGGVVNAVAVHMWGGADTRADWFFAAGWQQYLGNTFHLWPYVLWSALGIAWIVLISRYRRIPMAPVVVGLTALLGIVIPLIAFDQTRVLAQALLPALLVLACRAPAMTPRRYLVWGAVAVVVPSVVVAGGKAWLDGWGQMLELPTW